MSRDDSSELCYEQKQRNMAVVGGESGQKNFKMGRITAYCMLME